MAPKKFLVLPALLFLILTFPALGLAEDQDIPYLPRMPYRIVRGVTNVVLGWPEILLRPFGERKTESAGEALSLGAAHTLVRAAVGITDIVTFWVPDIQMLDLYPDWQGWPYIFHWS